MIVVTSDCKLCLSPEHVSLEGPTASTGQDQSFRVSEKNFQAATQRLRNMLGRCGGPSGLGNQPPLNPPYLRGARPPQPSLQAQMPTLPPQQEPALQPGPAPPNIEDRN